MRLVSWQEVGSLINDVDHAVSIENIGDRDAGRIGEDLPVYDFDVNVLSVTSPQNAVLKLWGVCHYPVHYMISKDLTELLCGLVTQDAAYGVEGFVVWGEDRRVLNLGQVLCLIRRCDGADTCR